MNKKNESDCKEESHTGLQYNKNDLTNLYGYKL